jgi:hypothetical protein
MAIFGMSDIPSLARVIPCPSYHHQQGSDRWNYATWWGESLGLTGEESSTVRGPVGAGEPGREVTVTAAGPAGVLRFEARARIDSATEAGYYRHGGIPPYALRTLLPSA